MCIIAISICILVLLAILSVYYTNVPPYVRPSTSSDLLSPASGTILRVNEFDSYKEVVIFLSPFDNHDQFYPLDGVITSSVYDRNGRFEIAKFADKSRYNEKVIVTMDTGIGLIQVKLIAGFLYRHITTENTRGDAVYRGDKLGHIHLGSRVDLLVPKSCSIFVKEGQRVYGGYTIIGRG